MRQLILEIKYGSRKEDVKLEFPHGSRIGWQRLRDEIGDVNRPTEFTHFNSTKNGAVVRFDLVGVMGENVVTKGDVKVRNVDLDGHVFPLTEYRMCGVGSEVAIPTSNGRFTFRVE